MRLALARLQRNWVLVLTAVFAMVWIVHRASVQSITLDEANTYRRWVAPPDPAHWQPNSNNHVLNSALMRLSVWLFGLGHVSVRLPALLGGLIYILASLRLCAMLSAGRLFRWALFACLVYNPFIMDYLVAARGYGLALGFLALAMYLLAAGILEDAGVIRLGRLAAISACIGLSITANFTFAFAGGFLLLAAAALAARAARSRTEGRFALRDFGRLAAAAACPAALILLVLAGSALTQFPRYELFWGTESLREAWSDIRRASFQNPNPQLVNPLLAWWLELLRNEVFRLAALFGACCFALLYFFREEWRRENRIQSPLLLASCLMLVLSFTVLAHWLQFKLMKIPLPLERTSIFVVPIATLMFGAMAVAVGELPGGLARGVKGLGLAILFGSGIHFTGALRDSHFREWTECAELRTAFPAILDACRRAGVREVAAGPDLIAALNFYREFYKTTEIDAISYTDDPAPTGKAVYVLVESKSGDFIRAEGLTPVWRGQLSSTGIFVRPERAVRPTQ